MAIATPGQSAAAPRTACTDSTMNVGLSASWSRLRVAALHQHRDVGRGPGRPGRAQLSGKTRTSEDPEKSSTVNRANSAPDRLLIWRLTAVTTTPSEIGSSVHVPSCDTVCVANSSHSTRIRLERMPGDVEAEDLLLLREPLGFRQRRDVGQHVRGAVAIAGRIGSGRPVAEQRDLALAFSCCLSDASCIAVSSTASTARDGRRARPARRTRSAPRTRACCTARRSTRSHEVEQRRERPLRARGEDRVDRRASDVADRAEPEADPLVADHGELVARLVHVGRQHLDARARAPR